MYYKAYSDHLKEKYGTKVYKLPVNIPASCPNRDGAIGYDGCTFCGALGAGFENLPAQLDVAEQLRQNMQYIGKRYGAKKFIAYFQNFTNTYVPYEDLERYMDQASRFEEIVEICFSTRPDCVSERYLDMISAKASAYGKQVSIELGLQSVNPHTLKKINRGHTLAEFIDAVIRIRRRGFEVCAHIILNLPWDDMTDIIEAAKIITALGVEQVKLHSLYIEKGTAMADQYLVGEFKIISPEEYVERAVTFLEYISPEISVQRLASRAPEENTIFCNWNMSWWRIRDMIEEKMAQSGHRQGFRCDYLDGDYEKLRKK